ncbi:hypothetical protein FWK35_00002825, partial [Aphis craccivora]
LFKYVTKFLFQSSSLVIDLTKYENRYRSQCNYLLSKKLFELFFKQFKIIIKNNI